MATDKIQFIIDNLQENLEVEVKNWLNGLAERRDQARLAKEIIALANSGGGYVFIGFDDNGTDYPEIIPDSDIFEAFTQDAIAGIVERYVMPPCQCRVEYYTRSGSEQQHPVIVVPGQHRTPIWARRGSESNELQDGKIYIRRPGGHSEVARNQDDWEKLIDRLVQARQTDMLSAIREILNPSSRVLPEEESTLEGWDQESYDIWTDLVDSFPGNDPRRLEQGHWTVSFVIRPFATDSLGQLNAVLDREMPHYSGWPPFTYLHRDSLRPRAHGNILQAYIGNIAGQENAEDRAEHSDFWRVSQEGYGYLLRPMQEDRPAYAANRSPRPQGRFFDWVLPIYRVTEVLKFIEALGQRFGDEGSTFQLLIRYYNTNGRALEQHTLRYSLFDRGTCHIDNLESRIEAPLSDIQLSVEELVYSILAPIYEQFDFTELPRNLVNNVVREVLSFR